MHNEPSPRPWRISEVDLISTEIWSVDGTLVIRGVSGPNAMLIVNAVNNEPMLNILKTDLADANKDIDLLREERSRLRDIVKRLANKLQEIIDVATGEATVKCLLDEALIREARDVIKEDK